MAKIKIKVTREKNDAKVMLTIKKCSLGEIVLARDALSEEIKHIELKKAKKIIREIDDAVASMLG